MFNQQELKILVGGAEEPIDTDDLRSHAVYGGLYDENHPTIQLFWRVVKSLDVEKRRMLLRFVTSCARPPLLYVKAQYLLLRCIVFRLTCIFHSGFRELRPKFAIRDAGTDTSRLPTASTCVNLLKVSIWIVIK
jgi:ubiquitin-protein ligase E3 C